MEPQDALAACIEMYGSLKNLAEELEVSPPAICYWRKTHVPKARVPQLVALSGNRLKHSDFRPDINWKFYKRWGLQQ